MSARNFGKDQNGQAIGPDSLVRIVAATGPKMRGWVLEYDEEKNILTLQDSKRGIKRYVRPEKVTVVKPSDMDKARRQGHDRSYAYYTDRLKRRKLRSEIGR
jgi:hypothetical protein